MNKFLKETLWLFAIFFLCGMVFSCMEDGYYFPRYSYDVAICNIPKFYDNKQGIYKGEVFLIRPDSSLEAVPETVEVELGNYANKDLVIKGFPIKYFFHKVNDGNFLASVPSYLLEKQVDISFKYFLYGYLEFQMWPSYKSIDGDSIDSSYYKSLYIGVQNNSNFYSDSVYNADKTQKLKYEVYGIEEGDSDAIILELCNLELDDKTFNPEYKVPLAKIKIGKKQVIGIGRRSVIEGE